MGDFEQGNPDHNPLSSPKHRHNPESGRKDYHLLSTQFWVT
jgi:hypothetical protein